jgi:RND family efflux transporter MFP subunit
MRIKNKILPLFALIGLSLAVAVAVATNQAPPKPKPAAQPAQAPYQYYIGGGGMVESSSRNIEIGTSIAGIVKDVPVKIGDHVKAGDPLFVIDDRAQQATVKDKQASLDKAKAALEEAKAAWKNYACQYNLVKKVSDPRAVSRDDVEQRRNQELLYRSKIETAKADVEVAEADLQTARTDLERLTVRAPVDGEVLQVNIRKGEYAATGVLDTPLLRFGATDTLHVRVDIDENDAWRFTPGTKAIAYIRGNRDLRTDLTFVAVEPYVVAKSQLTNSSTERVDTRVLQILFRFDHKSLPAFVGQQVDVFIETPDPDQVLRQHQAAQVSAREANQ